MTKSEVSAILRQALPVLLICGLFQFGAGSVLGGMEDSLKIIPGILVMVPPLLALRGSIGGALASRLGTGLHQGIIDPETLWSQEVKNNIGAALFLTFLVSVTTGVLSFSITILSGLHAPTLHFFLSLVSIAIIAAMLSGFGLIGLTVLIALSSYRRGWDPDNVTSPLTASIGDLITMASIYIAVIVVL